MESFMAVASLGGSMFSTIATFYFWLIRARGERPHLKPYVVDREFFLGASNPQSRQVGFKIGLVVANYSTLPNSLLKAKVSFKTREDQTLDVTGLTFDKQTPLPFNLPPLHTVLLRLNGTLSFPYAESLEQGNATLANYLNQHLAEPRQMHIELLSLNDRVDRFDLPLPATA